MKKILINLHPNDVCKIFKGEITALLRKRAPRCELPIRVFVYCRGGIPLSRPGKDYGELNGKIVGSFILEEAEPILMMPQFGTVSMSPADLCENAGLSIDEIIDYFSMPCGELVGYAWKMKCANLLEEPISLSRESCKEFYKFYRPGREEAIDDGIPGYYANEEKFRIKKPPKGWMYVESHIDRWIDL